MFPEISLKMYWLCLSVDWCLAAFYFPAEKQFLVDSEVTTMHFIVTTFIYIVLAL